MRSSPFDVRAPITQHFGVPHQRYIDLGMKGHNGIDYAVPLDTEVLAVEAGEVWETAFNANGYGYYIKVRTPEGADWLYAHLQLWMLRRPGLWLNEGDHVGWSGSSGMSTGPHLHLGYRPYWWVRGWPYDGYQDPLEVLERGS